MVRLGLEPGPQDWRRRRNHGTSVATPISLSVLLCVSLVVLFCVSLDVSLLQYLCLSACFIYGGRKNQLSRWHSLSLFICTTISPVGDNAKQLKISAYVTSLFRR